MRFFQAEKIGDTERLFQVHTAALGVVGSQPCGCTLAVPRPVLLPDIASSPVCSALCLVSDLDLGPDGAIFCVSVTTHKFCHENRHMTELISKGRVLQLPVNL